MFGLELQMTKCALHANIVLLLTLHKGSCSPYITPICCLDKHKI